MSNTKVKIQIRDLGDIVVELFEDKAPLSCDNFLKYVKDGYYDGVIFHRVIKGFMIQGGGYVEGMKQKETREAIVNEANNGLKNEIYTLSMARTNAPHSATAQFFINTANNKFLDHTKPETTGWGYAVFGKVIEGTEVVDQIEKVKVGRVGFHDDVPVQDVVIESITVLE